MHVKDLVDSRELLANLTLRELRARYKRSALGWAWSLLNPLATMAIFTVVFAQFLKVQPPEGDPSGLSVFGLYLLCGLLPWNFFSGSVAGSMGTLLGNAALVKKVAFARETLVFANVAALFVTLLVEMGLLSVVLLIAGNMVLPWLLPTLVLLFLLAVFATGFGLVFSVLNVYFRDLQHLIGIVLQIWFYLTPIVYPIDLVTGSFRWLYDLNPLVVFVTAIRNCLYDLRFPALDHVAYLVGVSFASLAFGLWVFGKLNRRLAEEL